MQYQYIPYTWTLIVSTIATSALGIYVLIKRRSARGAKSFILSMFVVSIWAGGNTLEMAALDFPTKLFWANMQYFAYCYSPVTLLSLCMQFTGYNKWVQNKKILLLALLPTLIVLLVWTDPLHGLMRYDMQMDYGGLFPVIAKKYGPVFYIHFIYSYALNLTAGIMLIRGVFFKNTVYRRQAAALLIGLCLIVIPNSAYVLGLSPFTRFDVTPVFFGVAGFIMVWSIFRFRFFDIVPIARAAIIETMDAGVMVLDLQDRILDTNPIFEKMVGINASKIVTRGVEEVCSKIPELAAAAMNRGITHTEFSIHKEGLLKTYEVLFSPLTDHKRVFIGRLAVIYEITEKKLAQQEFLKQQRKLAAINEREQMARDMHDNLGQVLGFINLQAQGIKQELMNAGIDTGQDQLERLINVTQAAHTEMREFIQNVRHLAYAEKDFIDVLKKEIERFKEQTRINVNLKLESGVTGRELGPKGQFHILNIIKEGLNNIRKHAEAKNVTLSFSLEDNKLCAVIADDGKGFETIEDDNAAHKGFGLSIMEERASEIGGRVDIKSLTGKGSCIMLYVPIKEGEKNADEVNAGR